MSVKLFEEQRPEGPASTQPRASEQRERHPGYEPEDESALKEQKHTSLGFYNCLSIPSVPLLFLWFCFSWPRIIQISTDLAHDVSTCQLPFHRFPFFIINVITQITLFSMQDKNLCHLFNLLIFNLSTWLHGFRSRREPMRLAKRRRCFRSITRGTAMPHPGSCYVVWMHPERCAPTNGCAFITDALSFYESFFSMNICYYFVRK